MSEEFSFEDARPRSWLDAFPWLQGVAEPISDPWRYEVIDVVDPVVRRRRLGIISELAIEHLTQWTIGEIFPGLAPELDLRLLQLPTRGVNALGRQQCVFAADLVGITLQSMMEWRQVGIGTVHAILRALADASTSVATPTVTADYQTAGPVRPLPSTEIRLPPWMSSLVDDLTQVATWYATVGLPDQPLLGAPLSPDMPGEVAKAHRRLDGLKADDILDDGELEMDIAAIFDDALRMLDPRATLILADRLFADDPITLDQIGRDHGVSRERVRQIEGKARGAMLGFMSDGSLLDLVAETVRALIGTIRPLDDLLAIIPALSRTVESVGQPAWRVLDRLDDAYQIEDGWCVVPTMTAAQTATQTQLQEQVDEYGVARIDQLKLLVTSQPEQLPGLTAAWLMHCGYIIDGDFVLTQTQAVGDYAAAVLSLTGTPLSSLEILDRFVFERSPGSLRNAISIDDRFERVDRDRWALSEWGLEGYSGIRSLIREQVTRNGGHANLNDLVEHITGRYSVSASSVVAYASSPPFENREGIVRLAGSNREIRKAPERTRRLFRRPGGWGYRIRITTDHLRGSGSVAPMAIASILDLQFGQTRQLDSPLGPQAVAWTGIQPSFGTVRRFLLDGDIAADTEAFLVIHDNHTFSFELVRELIGNPLCDALSLVGAPPTVNPELARTALTTAIGLPEESSVAGIIGGYRERGDTDIADLLMSARDQLDVASAPQQRGQSTAVDDILDLL